MSDYHIFDLFFDHQVKFMYSGIEATMESKDSLYTCALALSTYTEVMGGLVTGNLREEYGHSQKNYEAFLSYLGEKYVKLNNELKEQKLTLHKIIRNKLVHEFALRESHIIMNSEIPTDEKIGIEVRFFDNKIIHLNFLVKEYYRDFKNGVAKYRDDLKFSERQPAFSDGQILFMNFIRAVVENHQSEES